MSENLPTVSVIIPAKNASQSLPDALLSIERQTYPNIIEVIVAAADDETAAVAQGTRVIPNPEGSTPAGLNAAIESSTGDVIVRCDAHSVLPLGYIERAVETMIRTGAVNVGGMQVPVGTTPWEEAIAVAMTSRVGAGDARYRTGGPEGPVETVYLGVFRRDALTKVGGFDTDFTRTQDYELNHRLIESGGIVWFDPELSAQYRPRDSLSSLASQYYGYGQAKRQFGSRHKGHLRARQWAPPALVVLLGASIIASVVIPWMAALPAIYLATLLVGAFVTTRQFRMRVTAALATMHISWGIGFLRG